MNINKSLKYDTIYAVLYYTILLNVESSNLVFLTSNNTDFNEFIITFTDQNGRPLEIEYKVSLTFLINKKKRHALRAQLCDYILQNQEQKNMLKVMDFNNFQ